MAADVCTPTSPRPGGCPCLAVVTSLLALSALAVVGTGRGLCGPSALSSLTRGLQSPGLQPPRGLGPAGRGP